MIMKRFTCNIKQSLRNIWTLLLVAMLVPAAANAAEDWKLQTGANFQGEGTKENPYLIQKAQDLASLAYEVSKGWSSHKDYEGMYFKQTKDIVLNDDVLNSFTIDAYGRVTFDDGVISKFKEWLPIGIYGRSTLGYESPYWFKGHYDGDGHSISGIYCYRGALPGTFTDTKTGYDNYLGLFGAVQGGSIKNLTLKDCIIRVSEIAPSSNEWRYIGSVVGKAVDEEISNCTVENTVICFDSDNDPTECSVGGVVGYCDLIGQYHGNYEISNCSFTGKINVFNGNAQCSPNVGGICGTVNASAAYLSAHNNPKLSHCIARGVIAYNYDNKVSVAEKAISAGGILGRFSRPSDVSYTGRFAEIYRSTNFINMELVSTSSDVYAGGLSGYMASGTQSANFGNISINKTGGSVNNVYAGGIGTFTSIDNCVNYGKVELGTTDYNASVNGHAYIGGLAVCGLGVAATSENPCKVTNSAVCSDLYRSDASKGQTDAICVFSNATDSKDNVYYYSEKKQPTLYAKAVEQSDKSVYRKYSTLLEQLNENARKSETGPNIWGQLDVATSTFYKYIMPLAKEAVPSVKLDENSDDLVNIIANNDYQLVSKVSITLLRGLKQGYWNTICLPFDMTADELTANFGSGVKLESIKSATIENGVLTIIFNSSEVLKAGMPYLIKPTAVNGDDNMYVIGSHPLDSRIYYPETKVGSGTVSMIGSYAKFKLEGNESSEQYFLQGDKFYHIVPSNPLTAKGFRCYFAVSKDITLNKAMVKHDDGSTTAISIVEVGTAADGSQKIYDLRGIEQSTTPKGIYIRNGKKFSMK